MTAEINNSGSCITFWNEELNQVTNRLLVLEAEQEDAQKELDCIDLWEDLLKEYWTNISDTNKKVKEGAKEIRLFKRHAKGLKDLTGCTVEASQWLFCLVEDYFRCMDQLKKEISDLLSDIECLNNPEIISSSIIYSVLTELNAKLELAISKQGETIRKTLDMIGQAQDLDESLGNMDRPGRSGLIWLLKRLHQLFHNHDMPSTDPDHSHDGTSYGMGCPEPLVACDANMEPKPQLPLEYDPYYQKTKEQYEELQQEEQRIRDRLEDVQSKKDDLASKEDSLKKAITASTAAKACK